MSLVGRPRKSAPNPGNGTLSEVTEVTEEGESSTSFPFTEEVDDAVDADNVELSVVRLELQLPASVHAAGNICIVGNHESLGDWDPQKGFLIGLAEGERSFLAELFFPLNVEEIEYKYVIVDGYDYIWENGENRRLALNSGEVVEVADQWYS